MLRTSVHRSVSAAAARAQICRRLSASTAIHLESATEPVLHAERCLRRALAERTPARCGSPLNLSGSDDLVKIALATPAVHASNAWSFAMAGDDDVMQMSSVKKKRRMKMNKHKRRKRRKRDRMKNKP